MKAASFVKIYCSLVLVTSIAMISLTSQSALARSLSLTVGKADTIRIGGNVADILVADPSVVDVGPLQSNKVYLVGQNPGHTNVLVFDASGNTIETIDVNVRVDHSLLQKTISQLFPDEEIEVKTVNDDIVLTGKVANPAVASRVQEIASRFVNGDETIINLMDVVSEQQVMLRVRVLEASREVLSELGIEANLVDNNTSTTLGHAGAALATTAATGLTKDPFGVGTFMYNAERIGTMSLTMRALEQDGLISTLAEPNLTAISGEQAGFLAGGQFPIPTGRDRDGNITIEYKSFGVGLNFRPTVLTNDRISLQLTTEVSSLSTQNSITLNQIQIPAINMRRAETVVEIGSGGSLMIAGLLKSETVSQMSDVPGLNKLPIIGDLISSDSFSRDESELIIMITPYLVSPFADKTQAKVTEDAQVVAALDSVSRSNPLAEAFLTSLRRHYGDVQAPADSVNSYGYIVD